MDRIDETVEIMKKIMDEDNIDPTIGLPDSLYKFVTSITPIPNVDLFVADENKRVLLAWRDDEHYGQGWHIPGGCIRLFETMDERIQRTALSEIGTRVNYKPTPLKIVESIATSERLRKQGNQECSHNISILYEVSVPVSYDIEEYNRRINENKIGYLKWFDYIPDNLLECQKIIYKDFLVEWFSNNL